MRNVFEAIKALREIEDRYGIYFYAKGVSYGGARLMVRDVKTGDAYEVEEMEAEMNEFESAAGLPISVANQDVSEMPKAV